MKLALLYTGLPDNFKANSVSHRLMFDQFDTDTYIASWDHISIDNEILPYVQGKVISYTQSNLFRVSNLIDGMLSTMSDPTLRKEAVAKCMLGYYTMQQAYNSIPFPESYDGIIRLRFDIALHRPMDADQVAKDCKLYNAIYGWKDRLNYGNPIAMGRMLDIFTKNTNWYIGPTRPNIEILFDEYLRYHNIYTYNNFRDFSIDKGGTDVRNQHLVS
jgi:hypothetical protein